MFSKRLKEAIDKKGVSRYQISKDTQITEATLSNYCNGKVNPTPVFIKILAEYLEVDTQWLATGEASNSESNTNSVKEAGAKYRTRKKHYVKNNLNSIIRYFEEQLNIKEEHLKFREDELLKRTISLEEKVDLLIKEIRKSKK